MPTPGLPRIPPPRSETAVPVDGRQLGIAEYGDPDGRLVLWFHGTPGARRQLSMVGRRAALNLGLRVVVVERPGTGASTQHRYRRIVEFAADAAVVADRLGHQRFGVVGLSGGGPYALACGATMPERVPVVGVLGGVCPTVGPSARGEGLVALSVPFQPVLEVLRLPLGVALRPLLLPILPVAHLLYGRFARLMPEGDQVVLADPEIEGMFLDDLAQALRGGLGAPLHDATLFGRDWGFSLADVAVPVRWWHGDADSIIAFEDAQQACAHLPDVELHIRPGESHLGGFAVADEVLEAVSTYL